MKDNKTYPKGLTISYLFTSPYFERLLTDIRCCEYILRTIFRRDDINVIESEIMIMTFERPDSTWVHVKAENNNGEPVSFGLQLHSEYMQEMMAVLDESVKRTKNSHECYAVSFEPTDVLRINCPIHIINCGIKRKNGELSFLQWADKHPNTFAAKKFYESRASSAADKMWSSIIEFANRALEPFDFEEARTIFGNPEGFDIRDLGRKKTVLFLNVSDTDRAFDQLVNVFYTQALQLLCSEADKNPDGRLKVPVRIMMDDFAASARIPDFDKIISVIRSREISVSIILQSLTQLQSMYKYSEAATITNNCDHLLYLGSQDIDTANFIACRVCRTPETVMCMPRDKAVLITSGERARFVDKVKPYSTI